MAPEGLTDRRRFEDVVLPQLDAAYGLARWLLRDPALAQDVVQDAMLRALSHFGTYRGGDPRAWVLRIVRNAAYEVLARRSTRAEAPLEDAVGLADDTPDAERHLAARQEAGRMEEAIAALPPELRECLVLRELEEMPYAAIAEVTGVPVGTVMSRLWRARRALRGVPS